jgi:prevent-host-death family protein
VQPRKIMVLSIVTTVATMNGRLELNLSQRITASQFKARCLALMDQVAATGEVLLITKNGRPVAELHPCSSSRCPSPFGLHPDVQLHGDVISPIESSWSALQ